MNRVVFIFFLVSVVFAQFSQAEMPQETFDKVLVDLDQIKEALSSDRLNSEQTLRLANKIAELAESFSPAKSIDMELKELEEDEMDESSIESDEDEEDDDDDDDLFLSNEISVPFHVKKMAELEGNSVFVSPAKSKDNRNTIYGIFAFNDEYLQGYVPRNERVDLRTFRREFFVDYKKDLGEKEKIFWQLLEVEKTFRKNIKKDQQIFNQSLYVGLAENFNLRVKSHINDICNPTKALSSTKSKYINEVLHDFDVRINALVYHAPKNKLKVFECLLADMLYVQANASAIIGDSAAWELLHEYYDWETRKSVLEDAELLDFLSQLRSLHTQRALNIGSDLI